MNTFKKLALSTSVAAVIASGSAFGVVAQQADSQLEAQILNELTAMDIQVSDTEMLSTSELAQIKAILDSGENSSNKEMKIREIIDTRADTSAPVVGETSLMPEEQLREQVATELQSMGFDADVESFDMDKLTAIKAELDSTESVDRVRLEELLTE